MNKNFWKNKRVLITGDTGFKGSWLALALSGVGAKIQGLSSSKFNGNNDFYDALEVQKISHTVDLDIRDLTGMLEVCKNFQPEVVFHLAAQALVRESYLDPVTTYDVNVMGTLNVLEAVRKTDSVEAAILITTDKCYENQEWDWGYRETDHLGGYDPYSSSKGCAEILIQSYQRSFFNDLSSSPGVSSVRAGNVIGGGDFSQDRLIPDLYRAITSKKNLLLCNPNATRPWQHVLESLSGYITVAEDLSVSGASKNNSWNFGPHITDIRSVQSVSQLFCSSWGCGDILEYENIANPPHEAGSLSLDISKAFFQLGWSPQWTLEEAIQKTANLYRLYFEEGDCFSECSSQIAEYFDK